MEIAIINQKKESVGSLSLESAIWQQNYSVEAVSLCTRAYLASKRQKGVAKTKSKGEVSGGGRKPWKQKGTGRARQGSTRNPQWRHGGIAHGPTGKENYTLSVNRKVRQRALQSVLKKKIENKEIMLIDKIGFQAYKTKEANNFLIQIGLQAKKTLIIFSFQENQDGKLRRPFANLEKVQTTDSKVNVYQLLNYPHVIFTQTAFNEIERRLKS